MNIVNSHRFSNQVASGGDGNQVVATTFNGFGNRSRSFNGSSQFVDLGDSDDFSFGDGANDSPFSVCFWAKVANNSKFRAIGKNVTGSYEWLVATDSGGNLNVYLISGGIFRGREYTTPLPENEWIHVSATYDGSGGANFRLGLKLYVNGVKVDNADFGSGGYVAMTATSNPLEIGKYQTTYANGKMADVRLYNAELTASQISDLYAGTDVQTNLVGHWLTDADNVLDAAGTNHGTNYGTKYSYDNPSPPVEFGSASRIFNGSSDYVNLGQTTDNAIFTASAWVKFNSHSSSMGEGIFGKWQTATNGAWLLYTQSTSNYLTFIVRNSANDAYTICSSGIVPTLGQWTHIAGVADGTNLTIYINGVSEGSIAYDGTINNATSDNIIGAYNNTLNNNHHVDGKIADARIYDTDLSASQVSDLYSGTDVLANLVGHWLTDNDDVEDKAGTNDGTNFGSTYSYDNPPMDLVPSRQASRDFSGVSQHVEMSDVLSIGTGSLSWSCWLNADSTANTRGIVRMGRSSSSGNGRYDGLQILLVNSKISGYLIDYNNSGSVFSIQSTSGVVGGKWHHAVVSLDENAQTLELFVDGVSEGSVSLSSIHPWDITAQDPPSIGAREIADGNFTADEFNGKIADVRLYDSGLTSTEVLAIYNGTTDRTNLIGQWLTNSDDVLDHAGTNDGTNFGSTYSTDSPS